MLGAFAGRSVAWYLKFRANIVGIRGKITDGSLAQKWRFEITGLQLVESVRGEETGEKGAVTGNSKRVIGEEAADLLPNCRITQGSTVSPKTPSGLIGF